jgi:hypothetical protein
VPVTTAPVSSRRDSGARSRSDGTAVLRGRGRGFDSRPGVLTETDELARKEHPMPLIIIQAHTPDGTLGEVTLAERVVPTEQHNDH